MCILQLQYWTDQIEGSLCLSSILQDHTSHNPHTHTHTDTIRMALLYRFTKLNDRHNTGIFTFIVTRSVTRDLHRDATTKDFYYGYHRWAISFTRANDKSLGVYLILRNASPSTECFADYTLTLLNREHFSRNEQHTEKQCKFTADRTTQVCQLYFLFFEFLTFFTLKCQFDFD